MEKLQVEKVDQMFSTYREGLRKILSNTSIWLGDVLKDGDKKTKMNIELIS